MYQKALQSTFIIIIIISRRRRVSSEEEGQTQNQGVCGQRPHSEVSLTAVSERVTLWNHFCAQIGERFARSHGYQAKANISVHLMAVKTKTHHPAQAVFRQPVQCSAVSAPTATPHSRLHLIRVVSDIDDAFVQCF